PPAQPRLQRPVPRQSPAVQRLAAARCEGSARKATTRRPPNRQQSSTRASEVATAPMCVYVAGLRRQVRRPRQPPHRPPQGVGNVETTVPANPLTSPPPD